MEKKIDRRAKLEEDMLIAGEQMLREGRKVVYPVNDLPPNQMVRQYPDGTKMIVQLLDGKLQEIDTYH